MDTSSKNVVHNKYSHRFELTVGDHTGVLNYTLTEEVLTFTHTGVPPAVENRGIGSKLVKAGLEYAREQGLRVRSLCWFVSKYIRKHPEYQDLM